MLTCLCADQAVDVSNEPIDIKRQQFHGRPFSLRQHQQVALALKVESLQFSQRTQVTKDAVDLSVTCKDLWSREGIEGTIEGIGLSFLD
jgi:hypothetical protein